MSVYKNIDTYKYIRKNYILIGGKNQWTELCHNGPMFPPEYIPHNIPIICNNINIILNPLAEEYATLYSKFINTEYVKNTTFNKNFWNDFKKSFTPEIKSKVKSLKEIDFSLIYSHLIDQNETKKLQSKEEKEQIKQIKEKEEEKYKYCLVDGVKQTVGNYKIEPPGIFLGRGKHPKLGTIKKRLYPNDIIINISKTCEVPKPNLKGTYKWKKVINDKKVIWLASWKDLINNKNKYIFTNFDSIFKSKSDETKFDLARNLKKNIDKIRKDYSAKISSKDDKLKQLSTALYLIDTLALRVGNQKNTEKSADTVGVTSLRVEHIIFNDNNEIVLNFLSKDSIRYCKKIIINEKVYNNLKDFVKGKKKDDDIFDLINPNILNEYLNSYMKNLTSKVWRTYNASHYFQEELSKINPSILNKMDKNEKINYLQSIFNKANASVAILCNHQKNNTSDLKSTLDKMNEQIKKLTEKKKTLTDKDKKKAIDNKITILKLKKETKKSTNNIALGTSKTNYIDPRIIFSFIKKYDIPIEKIMSKALIKRFEWASKVGNDFIF